ncbi:MAG: hypothetical protein IT196_11075 [Acidimicrobiales bacterium]|nr:hypothetical protein [Acidimicrobiales bacterium]
MALAKHRSRLTILTLALMAAFVAFGVQWGRGAEATGTITIFSDCFDLGSGDTNCVDDGNDSDTVDSNNAVAWTEVGGSADDCRIQDEELRVRDGCAVVQTSLSTLGRHDVELEYDFGVSTDLDLASPDGNLRVQWRVGGASPGSWVTLQSHDLECRLIINQNLYPCVNHIPTDTHFSLSLGPTADNLPMIDVRFFGETFENDDQALVDNVLFTADPYPTVQFGTTTSAALEATGTQNLAVTLSGPIAHIVTVNYAVTGGTATGGGTDYTLASGTLSFPANSVAAQNVPLQIVGDSLYEPNETVEVTLSSPTWATLGANTVRTHTIQNDDPAPTVTLSQSVSSFAENGGINTVKATLSALSGLPTTVNLGYSGSATHGTDYSGAASIVIPAGSSFASIDLTGIDDFVDEDPPAESVVVDITSVVNGTESGTQQVSSTIIENDQAGVTVTGPSGATHPITGNKQTTEVSGDNPEQSFTVVLDSQPTADVTIDVTSSDETEGKVSSSGGTPIAGGVRLKFTATTWNTPQTVNVDGQDDFIDDGDVDYTVVIGATASTDPRYNGTTEGPWDAADIDLTNVDNDTAGFIVKVADASDCAVTPGNTTEAGGKAYLCIKLASEPLDNVTIPHITSDDVSEGTVPGGDAGPLTFTPANWNTFQAVEITGANDDYDDGNIEYTIDIAVAQSSDAKYEANDPDNAEVVNTDDDSAGVAVAVLDNETAEAGGSGSFSVVLTSKPTGNVTVALSSSDPGEGTAGVALLTFTPADWNAPQVVTVAGVDDDIDDGDVAYSIVTGAAGSTDSDYAGRWVPDVAMTNVDDDTAGVTVTPSAGSTTTEATGDNPEQSFSVVLDSEPTADVTVNVVSGDASEGSASVGSLLFTSANWDSPQSVDVSGVDDADDDGDVAYNIILTTSSADPDYAALNPADQAFTNLDNDDAPEAQFGSAASSSVESATPQALTVELNRASSTAVTVNFTVTGTATGGGVDHALASGSIVIPAWATSGNIMLPLVDDELDEDAETVVVTIDSVSYGTVGATTVRTHTIDDNDAAPSVQFDVASSSGAEDSVPTPTIDVELSAPSGKTVTVDYAITGGTADAGDRTLAAGTLTFVPGDTVESVPLAITADLDVELNETVVIGLSNAGNASLGGNTAHTYTILDDDGTPGVSFAAASSSGDESDDAKVVVTLSAPYRDAVTVDYAFSHVLTDNGDISLANGALTFAPGETSKTINGDILDDTADEPSETFTLTLSNPVNAVLGSTTVHTYTILDNDIAPGVGFKLDNSGGPESATPASLEVVLSEASGKTATVDYTVTGGTATGGGTDYTLATGTLTFTPGDVSENVSITVVDDSDSELDETIRVTLGAPSNAFLMAHGNHTYTIEDNDAPTVGFTTGTSTSAESADSASLNVVLSGPQSDAVTVDFAVSGTSTATNGGVDYTLADGTLTFAAGETSKPINLDLVDDELDENTETVVVDLSSPAGATLGAIVSRTHTLTDNDGPPAVSFLVDDSSAAEGDTGVNVEVVLSEASGKTVTVNYTVAGTAGNPGDHNLAAGTVTFLPGDTSENITFDVADDSPVFDDDETIVIRLVNPPANATLGSPHIHTVTIDDPAVLAAPSVSFGALPKYSRSRTILVNVAGGLGTTGLLLIEDNDETPPVDPLANDPRWKSTIGNNFTLSNRDGVHTLYAWAKNAAGEVSVRAIRQIFLDRKAPVTRVTSPVNGQKLTDLKSIAGIANDPQPASGVARVMIALRREVGAKCYYWNGTSWRQKGCNQQIWLRTRNPQFWNIKLPYTNPKFDVPGRYSAFSRGADVAGNTNKPDTFTLGTNWIRFEIVE